LSGSIRWDVAPAGLSYVTWSLSLASPASNFAAKTNALVYFQIEKPVFPVAEVRLNQTATTNTTNTTKPANTTNTNTTAPVVSGTGDFEGHSIVFVG